MIRDIYIAFIGLSVGWGMHASLAARFCFRCVARRTGLRILKFSQRKMPKFLMQLIAMIALGWYGMIVIQEIAEVFGWKFIGTVFQNLLKGANDATKKAKNVS